MFELVEASWLAGKLQHYAAQTLILDTRSKEESSWGSIISAVHIRCDGILLRRLTKGTIKMASLLHLDEDKAKYSASQTSGDFSVVILDQNSENAECLAPDSMAALVLKKVCCDCQQVAFLRGGYKSFSRLHPELCSTPTGEQVLLCRPNNLVLKPTTVAQPTLGLALSQHAEHTKRSSAPDNDSGIVEPFRILPYLYLGCKSAAKSLEGLRRNRITCILNVTTHIPNHFQGEGFTYKQIAVEDRLDVDMSPHLEGALQFIEETRERGAKVLVHCHAGRSRSVTIVLAYLMKHCGYTLHGALAYVMACKPDVSPNLSFMGQLLEYEEINCCKLSPMDSGLGSSPVEGHYFMPSPPPSNTPLMTPISFHADFQMDPPPLNV